MPGSDVDGAATVTKLEHKNGLELPMKTVKMTPVGTLLALLTVLASSLMIIEGCSSRDGRDVYIGMGCPQCHGFQAEGLVQGPALKNLSDHWTRDELDSYLQNPTGYMSRSPRLQDIAKRYTSKMPAFTMGNENREKLVEFLLGL
jgi:hypothetical protein